MLEMALNPLIKGFTTNPTLMRKAGVGDYESFARDILTHITERPISFEVFADDHEEMERQARHIASWGRNVFVKIPITTTDGTPTVDVIERLSRDGVKVNVTALMTPAQVRAVTPALSGDTPSFVSVFAGRIADTGRDPLPVMQDCLDILAAARNAKLIWASPRELLNIFQADQIGCHVITVTNDVLKKLELIGKDLNEFSQDTVRMFFEDGRKAGYTLDDEALSIATGGD
jgi:transaldolase